MKNIILLTVLTLTTLACKAQSPIIALDDRNDLVPNAYYKDIDNDLNKYIGTWLYTNGTTSFTIELQKIEQMQFVGCYFDTLIGDYNYIENGTEIVNSLPRLNNPNYNDVQHLIKGNDIIYKGEYPGCSDCALAEKRIRLFFSDLDPTRKHLSSYLAIRYVNDNGVEKIEAQIVSQGTTVIPEGAPTEPRVPYGDYTLIKQ